LRFVLLFLFFFLRQAELVSLFTDDPPEPLLGVADARVAATGRAYIAIVKLYDDLVGQLVPPVMNLEDAHIGVIVEVGAHQLGVAPAEGKRGFFNGRLEFEEVRFKLLLDLPDIGENLREAPIGIVGDEVKNLPA